MLHCDNEFRMEVCSFRFKFDDLSFMIWFPEMLELLVAAFLELLNILALKHKVCLKTFLLIVL